DPPPSTSAASTGASWGDRGSPQCSRRAGPSDRRPHSVRAVIAPPLGAGDGPVPVVVEVDRVHELAIDVELKPLGRGVAIPHRHRPCGGGHQGGEATPSPEKGLGGRNKHPTPLHRRNRQPSWSRLA